MGNVTGAVAAAVLTIAGASCNYKDSGGKEAPEPKTPAERVVAQAFPVAGYQITIVERGDSCLVEFEGMGNRGELRTALKPFCRFVQAPVGSKPAQFTYDDIGGATVLILVGTPEDAKAAPAIPEAYCGTQSQGIVLRREGVSLSARVGRGRKCAAGQDEKEFWLFSH